jgi:hypothetical protein
MKKLSTDDRAAAMTEGFGTTLHAQQYLFDNQGKPGFNPANPPTRASHCYFADGESGLQEHKGTGHFSRWQDPVVLARDQSLRQGQDRGRQHVPAGRTLTRLRIRPAVHVRCGEASCDQRQEPDRDARALERDLQEPDCLTGTRLSRSAGAGDMVGSR